MAQPHPEVLAWTSAMLGGEVTVVRSLRLGGPVAVVWLAAAAADGPVDNGIGNRHGGQVSRWCL
jgi:hypothetical protein